MSDRLPKAKPFGQYQLKALEEHLCELKVVKEISFNENSFLTRDDTRCVVGTHTHTGKCIRRFAGIYAYCRYFIDRKW